MNDVKTMDSSFFKHNSKWDGETKRPRTTDHTTIYGYTLFTSVAIRTMKHVPEHFWMNNEA